MQEFHSMDVKTEPVNFSNENQISKMLKGANDLDMLKYFCQQMILKHTNSRIQEILNYHLSSGGKLIRSRFCLHLGNFLQVSKQDCIIWASACELLHNASLIHDDIQDQDHIRRNKKSVWKKFGIASAINAGDALLKLPYLSLNYLSDKTHAWPLSKLLASTSLKLIEGQELDLHFSKLANSKNIEHLYNQCIELKTASLFELPAKGLLHLSPSYAGKDILEMAKKLGNCFQLQDDILDLFGDKGRKVSGNDIREGKLSSLIVDLLKLQPTLYTDVFTILNKPRSETSEEEIQILKNIIQNSGALSISLQKIKKTQDEFIQYSKDHKYMNLYSLANQFTEIIVKPIQHLY